MWVCWLVVVVAGCSAPSHTATSSGAVSPPILTFDATATPPEVEPAPPDAGPPADASPIAIVDAALSEAEDEALSEECQRPCVLYGECYEAYFGEPFRKGGNCSDECKRMAPQVRREWIASVARAHATIRRKKCAALLDE